jgi:hypothetical protein
MSTGQNVMRKSYAWTLLSVQKQTASVLISTSIIMAKQAQIQNKVHAGY